jgi:GGDEF domain-containing protein
VVEFVIVVALINIGVGYGLAVCLGYGPPDLWAAWIALGSEPLVSDPPAARAPLEGPPQQIAIGPEAAPAAPPDDLDRQASAPVLEQDPLTGLLNRAGLEAELGGWRTKGFQQAHALVATLYQLNDFERLNTDYGASRGDQVLHEIGQRLRQWNQPIDLVGRCADHRFLVVAVDTDEPSAVRRAEQTRQLIEALLPGDTAPGQPPAVQTATARYAADDTPATLLTRLEATLGLSGDGPAIGQPVALDA